MMEEEEMETTDDQGTFLRALPGGRSGSQDQVAVALLVALALAYLFLVRRGFRPVLST